MEQNNNNSSSSMPPTFPLVVTRQEGWSRVPLSSLPMVFVPSYKETFWDGKIFGRAALAAQFKHGPPVDNSYVSAHDVDVNLGRGYHRYHVNQDPINTTMYFPSVDGEITAYVRRDQVVDLEIDDDTQKRYESMLVEAGKLLGFDGSLFSQLFDINVFHIDGPEVHFNVFPSRRVIGMNYSALVVTVPYETLAGSMFLASLVLSSCLLLKPYSARLDYLGTLLDDTLVNSFYGVCFDFSEDPEDSTIHMPGCPLELSVCRCSLKITGTASRLASNAYSNRFELRWNNHVAKVGLGFGSHLVPDVDRRDEFKFWDMFCEPQNLFDIISEALESGNLPGPYFTSEDDPGPSCDSV